MLKLLRWLLTKFDDILSILRVKAELWERDLAIAEALAQFKSRKHGYYRRHGQVFGSKILTKTKYVQFGPLTFEGHGTDKYGGRISCDNYKMKGDSFGFFFNLEKGESYKDGDFKNSTHWLIGPEHDSEGDGDWEPITSEQWNDALAQWQKAIDIRGGK